MIIYISLLQYFIWSSCIVLEHILLEKNTETSKLRIILTLNSKKLTKCFEDGINGKKSKAAWKCRKEVCRLKYTLLQNWNRHEKAAGDIPPKRREVNEPFFDAHQIIQVHVS